MGQQISNLPRSAKLRHAGTKLFVSAAHRRTFPFLARWHIIDFLETFLEKICFEKILFLVCLPGFPPRLFVKSGREILGMRYGSVIFDMDGVILNSLVENEDWKFEAVEEALQHEQVDTSQLSREDMEKFLGDHGRETCIETCKSYGLDPEKVWNLIAETTSLARIQQVKDCDFRLYQDARSFLEMLEPRDPELGIISNAPESAVETTMKFFNLKKYFKFYRGIEDFEDLKLRKPHPDHLKIAEAELKRSPYLYIGDAVSDIRAAKNAGMDSAWVNRKNIQADIDPTYEVDDLEELGRKMDLF